MRRNTAILCLALGLSFGGAALSSSRASACGGFFCNRVPVDQSGENIAFSMEPDGSITAHIQILYTGPAESFAWILPVPSIPDDLGIGTDVLFLELQRTTAPQFQLDARTEGTCRPSPSCYYGGWDSAEGPRAGGFAADGGVAAADAGGGGVEVLRAENVGPYETVVLRAGDGATLYEWLRTNGYDIPASAEPEIDHYVRTGHSFVALRLSKDREAGEIQPITLHYASGQPCIPLRLTRIAATPDMPITAWFFSAQGVRSLNFSTVEPNLDDESLWLYGGGLGYGSFPGGSYGAKVAEAVDAAGGRAFVQDYSGAVPAMSIGLDVSLDDLRGLTSPKQVLVQLSRRLAGDSQLLAILQRHVPPPDGVAARDFYNCVVNDWCASYDAYLTSLSFSAGALVDALDAAIVQPRAEAQAMVGRHARVTRLFTIMSPDEMTMDPEFVASAAVPTSSNVHMAAYVTECSAAYYEFNAPIRLELPSGRSVPVRPGTPFIGSDAAYCRSVGASPYPTGPGYSTSWTRRGERSSGGAFSAICSASPAGASQGAGILGVGLVAVVALLARRRASRRGR